MVFVVAVDVALVKDATTALFADWPIPESTADEIAAKKEGSIKLQMTLFESITPFSFNFLLNLVCDMEQMKPTV